VPPLKMEPLVIGDGPLHEQPYFIPIAFWRSVGYRDYCLTLEIIP
jgi:hypothetical protein